MWIYLGEKIDVKEDGLFYVKEEFFESLAKAKSYIAQQKKSYYSFSHEDIDNMFKKLSNKEKDFLKHILKYIWRFKISLFLITLMQLFLFIYYFSIFFWVFSLMMNELDFDYFF